MLVQRAALAICVSIWQMLTKMLRQIAISLFYINKILPTQNTKDSKDKVNLDIYFYFLTLLIITRLIALLNQ